MLDDDRRLRGVRLESGEEIISDHVVLALGHSARDSFEMLYERGVAIEAKPFSIGFRIEHPQGLIDKARFGRSIPELGAAEYKLVHHAKNGRSVYSFCMCPGGTVVAATSEEGRVATNGMSQYSRNERNANAGIVVGITPQSDYPDHPLAGIELQRHWESRAFEAGGGTYAAPAQLVGDFVAGRASAALGEVVPSYRPGVTPDRPSSLPPGLCHRRHPRSPARLRTPDQRFRSRRCGLDGRRNPHLLAHPRPTGRKFPEPQHAGALSGG